MCVCVCQTINEAFYNCLHIWLEFLDYLDNQLESRISAKQSCLTRYIMCGCRHVFNIKLHPVLPLKLHIVNYLPLDDWQQASSRCTSHTLSACFVGQPCQGCARFSELAHPFCTRSSFRWCCTTGQRKQANIYQRLDVTRAVNWTSNRKHPLTFANDYLAATTSLLSLC